MSIGTLGGGNHFIEMDKDEEGYLYVAIHSGSRHLGKEVTEYYLKEGQKYLKEKGIQIHGNQFSKIALQIKEGSSKQFMFSRRTVS